MGGLDEKMFAYMEDFDLALRLRSAGWKAVLATDAVGVHLGFATMGIAPPGSDATAASDAATCSAATACCGGEQPLARSQRIPLVVLADLAISHDLAALTGRLSGWRAGRHRAAAAGPPAEAIDSSITFCDSLALRRGVYGRRTA